MKESRKDVKRSGESVEADVVLGKCTTCTVKSIQQSTSILVAPINKRPSRFTRNLKFL
jgi:hypothetical protein